MWKKIFLGLFSAVAVCFAVFFFLIFLVLNNESFQKNIIHQIEKQFRVPVVLKSVDLGWIPPISLVLKDVRIEGRTEAVGYVLTAPSLRVYLEPFHLLFKTVRLDRAQAEDVAVTFIYARGEKKKIELSLRKAELKLTNTSLRKNEEMAFTLKGMLTDSSGRISWAGKMHLREDAEKKSLEVDAVESEMELADVEITRLMEILDLKYNLLFKKGVFSWKGNVNWSPELSGISGSGLLSQVVYALPGTPEQASSAADFNVEVSAEWNRLSEELFLRKLALDSRYGKFVLKGNFNQAKDSQYPVDFEISASPLDLDVLPEFLIPLDAVIPTKLGFSGKMAAHFFLRGKKDDLALVGSVDFMDSLLSYANFFTKPKEIPARLQFNLLLKNRKILEGDSSLRLKDMTLKGALSSFDLESGEGEITLLSNKFSMQGWQGIISQLEDTVMSGEGKLLFTAKGNLKDYSQVSYVGDLSVENGQVEFKGWTASRLNAGLEFSNQRPWTGRMNFSAKSSPLELDFVWNHGGDEPSLTLSLHSAELYPHELIPEVVRLAQHYQGEEGMRRAKGAQDFLEKIFPPISPLRGFLLRGTWAPRHVLLEEVSFSVYDAAAKFSGDLNFDPASPGYKIAAEVSGLNLKALTSQLSGKPSLEGALTLNSSFSGDSFAAKEWQDHLQAEGNFKIMQGAFYTFDLLAGIATLSELEGINSFVSGMTPFDDLHANFVIRSRKLITDELFFVSPLMQANANGFFSFEGLLNYRWNVALGQPIQDKLFGGESAGGGPFSIQLYGDYAQPKIGFDTVAIGKSSGSSLADKFFAENQAKAE